MKRLASFVVLGALCIPAIAGEPPDWAYPLIVDKSVAPGSDESGPIRIPGSSRTYTLAQIDDLSNPPDWFPDEHAPMPPIVARGAGTAVPACAACHLASGMGHPESSHLAGLPIDYQLRQLADFKSNARRDGSRMNGIAASLSEDDMRQAAAWFAALKPIAWTRVIETKTVPQSYIGKGRMRFALDGPAEALGTRIVELPQDPLRAARRDPHSGFIAYVPEGSIAKGEALVKSGGDGKTLACATCHGQQLEGVADVPSIRGTSPLYLTRQLLDMQNGARAGPGAGLMKPVVDKLTVEDVIAIAAYLATLAP